jgi:tetratricopeptide (TPR) repeat protein
MSADAQQEATTALVETELGNVRAAIDWCLDVGRSPEQALAIAAPLWWYWWLRSAGEEGRTWLLRCLESADAAPTPARALGLRGAATLARTAGDYVQAVRLGEEALAAYRTLDDQLGVAAALHGLCNTQCHLGDYDAALPYALASVEQARAVGSDIGEATSLQGLSYVLRNLGRWDEAETANLDALAGFRRTRNRRNEGAALNSLAIFAYRRGEWARVRQLALESLKIEQATGFVEGQMDSVQFIATLAVAEGHHARGLLLLTVLDRERERMGVAPDREDMQRRDTAMAAAVAALDEPERAAVRAVARRTGLDAIVREVLDGGRR